MFHRITKSLTTIALFLLAAIGALFLAPADARAQSTDANSVNMDLLVRIIGGETILERGDDDDDEDDDDEPEEFTDDFPIADCRFVPRGKNDYFSLEPGYQLHLYGIDEDEEVELFITVLRQTYNILIEIGRALGRLLTRIVQLREFID